MSAKPLQVFVGFDSREVVAYHTLCNSIIRHASGPVSITPLVQSQLRTQGLYWRDKNPYESTEFSMTRFLVPYLCDYGGWAIFLDCDMILQADVYELYKYAKQDEKANTYRAVWCVQHDYTPSTEIKMDGCVQTKYPRKNWSSVMVFRNKFCDKLTPDYVSTASGLELHRMHWAGDNPENIGKLPQEWNHLVLEYPANPEAKNLHYTLGTPCFTNYVSTEHADIWWKEYEQMMSPIKTVLVAKQVTSVQKPKKAKETAHSTVLV